MQHYQHDINKVRRVVVFLTVVKVHLAGNFLMFSSRTRKIIAYLVFRSGQYQCDRCARTRDVML